MLATDPLSVDQHLKVVREATWEARAKWQCLGEELRVTMGKLQVRKCDIILASELLDFPYSVHICIPNVLYYIVLHVVYPTHTSRNE